MTGLALDAALPRAPRPSPLRVGQPELEAPAGADRDRSTFTVTLALASKAANILISRSSVKRPRSTLRMREKSAAANPVRLAAPVCTP